MNKYAIILPAILVFELNYSITADTATVAPRIMKTILRVPLAADSLLHK